MDNGSSSDGEERQELPYQSEETSFFVKIGGNADLDQHEFISMSGGRDCFYADIVVPHATSMKPTRWHRAAYRLRVGSYQRKGVRYDGVGHGQILAASFHHWMPPAAFKLIKQGKLTDVYFQHMAN